MGTRALRSAACLALCPLLVLSALPPAASATQADGASISVSVDVVNGTAFTQMRRVLENPRPADVWFELHTYFPSRALLSRIAVESGGSIVEEAQVVPIASVANNTSRADPMWLASSPNASAPLAGTRALDLAVRVPGAGSSVLIVGWTESLRAVRGAYRYALPLASLGSSTDFSFAARLVSQANFDSLVASAPFSVAIDRPAPRQASVTASHAVLPATKASLFLNFTPEPGGGHGLASSCFDAEGGFFTYTLFPSSLNLALEPLPKSVSFAVDYSGSMSGKVMGQAQDAMKEILHQLAPHDRFEVLRFDSRVLALTNGLQDASPQNVEAAIDRIYGQTPYGSTNIGDALDLALTHLSEETDSLPMVVLITDGAPNVGLTTLDEFVSLVEAKNGANASIHTLALGYETSDEILGSLSALTHGFHRVIDPGSDVVQQISDFYGEVSEPLIEDLTMQFTPPAIDAAVPPLPVLFAGSDITVHGRLEGGGTVTVTIEGRTTKGPFSFTDAFTPQNATCDSDAGAAFAAGTLEVLIAEAALSGAPPGLVENATGLALPEHLETPWTRFRLASGDSISTEPLPSPPEESSPPGQSGRAQPFLSEPTAPLLLVGLAAAAVAGSLILRLRRSSRDDEE